MPAPSSFWPSSEDYNCAVQNPALSFTDPDLVTAEVGCNALGLPAPRSGSFADVYEFRGVNGRAWAVKCFTRPVPCLAKRYAAVHRHLSQLGLPFAVGFAFLERGIRVGDDWYPVVKMDWVDGHLLNAFARDTLSNPSRLDKLFGIWAKVVHRLEAGKVVHGDLQHGNVLVVRTDTGRGAVTLVDYDGMVVPELAQTPSGEAGHPAYQHPEREKQGGFGPGIDRFSALVIATALRCARVGGTALWDRFDDGANLLFLQRDFERPEASPVFAAARAIEDPLARHLTRALEAACKNSLRAVPPLDAVLASSPEIVYLSSVGNEYQRNAEQTAPPLANPLPPTTLADPREPARPQTKADWEQPRSSDQGRGSEKQPPVRRTHSQHKAQSHKRLIAGLIAACIAGVGFGVLGLIFAVAFWPKTQVVTMSAPAPRGPGMKAPATPIPQTRTEIQDSPRRDEPTPDPVPTPDGFIPLFNGKDLTGWKTDPVERGQWAVQEGAIVGRGGTPSRLYTERNNYANFHLRAQVKINPGGNGGIYFRSEFGSSQPNRRVRCYTAQIDVSGSNPNKTGSLLVSGAAPVGLPRSPVGADVWFTLEIIARSNRLRILIDGAETADYTDPSQAYGSGHIALELGTPGSVLSVSSVELKELSGAAEVPGLSTSPSTPFPSPSPQPGLQPQVSKWNEKTHSIMQIDKGLVKAPDLKSWKSIRIETFEKAPTPPPGRAYQFANGNLSIHPNGGNPWWRVASALPEEFACKVEGWVEGDNAVRAGLILNNPGADGNRGAQVLMSRDGKLTVEPWVYNTSPNRIPRFVPISHTAIKRGGDRNVVILIVRRQLLEIYVNGVAVTNPINMVGPFAREFMLQGSGGGATARAVFEYANVYDATEQPTPFREK